MLARVGAQSVATGTGGVGGRSKDVLTSVGESAESADDDDVDDEEGRVTDPAWSC